MPSPHACLVSFGSVEASLHFPKMAPVLIWLCTEQLFEIFDTHRGGRPATTLFLDEEPGRVVGLKHSQSLFLPQEGLKGCLVCWPMSSPSSFQGRSEGGKNRKGTWHEAARHQGIDESTNWEKSIKLECVLGASTAHDRLRLACAIQNSSMEASADYCL